MGQVGSDAGGVDDIIEGELVNERGELQEQRQRLEGVGSAGAALLLFGSRNVPVQYRQRRRQQLSRRGSERALAVVTVPGRTGWMAMAYQL